MNTVIHPEFHPLLPFIKALPDRFDAEGETIYEGRNLLKRFHIEGTTVVVKRFKKPHLINRFAYGTIRHSKARRSYEYAIRLLQKHVPTPAPVAYIECYAVGLRYSYYVSLESLCRHEIREFCERPLMEEEIPVLEAFGRFTAWMHEQGILHLDYSPGNILFDTREGNTSFMLVDINRIQFEPVPEKQAYYNLRRLWLPDETYAVIARSYARERGYNEETAVQQILYYKNNFMKNRYK